MKEDIINSMKKLEAQFISDSSALSIYLDSFYRKYPFSKDNQLWESYLT